MRRPAIPDKVQREHAADGATRSHPHSEIAVNIVEFMRGYKVAWERHSPAMFAALLLPDGQYHNTPLQVGSTSG